MFTGLIDGIGTIKRTDRQNGSIRLTISASFAGELKVDESVAINGVCQTVVACNETEFSVIAIPETLDRSTLGDNKTGDTVHLERALQLTDRLDGHIVQGHVDGIAAVIRIEHRGDSREVWLRAPLDCKKYLAEKGSVALDGISLTVAKCRNDDFSVALIPHTLQITNAQRWRVGSKINLEVDVLAKYTERLLQHRER